MKIMKYILTFALFLLECKYLGTREEHWYYAWRCGRNEGKGKRTGESYANPRNTFIVNLGYGWITSRVEMRSGTYKWKEVRSIKWRTTGLVKRVMDSDWSVQLSALIFLKKLWHWDMWLFLSLLSEDWWEMDNQRTVSLGMPGMVQAETDSRG